MEPAPPVQALFVRSALDDAIGAAALSDTPTAIALMRILSEADTQAAASDALAAALRRREAAGQTGAARLRAVQTLWSANPQAWTVVKSTLSGIAHNVSGSDPQAVLTYWAATFDSLAAASPEASVALYSLGNADLLAAATAEVVTLIDEWGLLAAGSDTLEVGCGIGRFLPALASRSRAVVGIDISAGMVAEARRRCLALPNVTIEQSGGRDLQFASDASIGFVLAADVFPYLVQAGGDVAQDHVHEFSRILQPGGAALILNCSYRDDLQRDRRDIAMWAERAGLRVERNGSHDLRLWDGAAFLVRKPQPV